MTAPDNPPDLDPDGHVGGVDGAVDVEVPPVLDGAGRPLPGWVPADHPLAGTALRPVDSNARRASWFETWFPMLAMAPAPVALFLIWLRNPDNPESGAAGAISGGAVVVIALAWAAWRSRPTDDSRRRT